MKKLLLLLVLFPWGLYAQEYKQYSEIVIKPNWLITSSKKIQYKWVRRAFEDKTSIHY